MKSALIILLSVACLNGLAAAPQARPVHGVVFEDVNGNGAWDAGEPRLSGVPVSNADTVLLTDGLGRFSIEPIQGQCVFPVAPTGFIPSGNKVINTAAYLSGDHAADTLWFPFERCEVKAEFTLAAVGDIQVGNGEELSYAARGVFGELARRGDIDLTLFAGDLVNDNISLFPSVKQIIETMPFPSLTVAGNHDTPPRSSDFGPYTESFGAQDYAIIYNDVLFVVFNNVRFTDRRYAGVLDDRQLRFLGNLLAHVPRETLLVVCQHIPMTQTENADKAIAIAGPDRDMLILSGHTHTVGKHVFSDRVCEQGVGAPCGSWWTGEINPDGLPHAMQRCGSPPNYFIVKFSGGTYRLNYKAVGLDADRTCDVWIAGEEPADDGNPLLEEFAAGTFVVNVYGAGPSARVRASVDGGPFADLEHTPMIPPLVRRIARLNETAGYPTAHSRRLPTRGPATGHIWTGILPETDAEGPRIIEIEASDDHGLDITHTRIYTPR